MNSSYRTSVWLFVTVFLSVGCASLDVPSTVGRTVLAKTNDFAVVRVGERTSLESLAIDFLGDASAAGAIGAANNNMKFVRAGNTVVIPLRPRNRSYVFGNGYQTVPILCYHRFGKSESSDPLVVSAAKFRTQLKYLQDNDYNVITLKQFEGFLAGKGVLPPKAVVITIDDGYRSVLEIAYPLLQEYAMPATLFVYPDFVGGGLALSWEQVKTLHASEVIDIQSHSKSHASHSAAPDENSGDYEARIKQEVGVSKQVLQRRLGLDVDHYAYPYGDTSAFVVKTLESSGVDLAMTVQRGANGGFAAPHLLRRDMIYGQDSMETFAKRLKVFRTVSLK